MKKIVRLTESDLVKLVKKVMKENKDEEESMDIINNFNSKPKKLSHIYDEKGTLDHLINPRIKIRLIDGPFLKKNPDWENRDLEFLYHDLRNRMGVVKLVHEKLAGMAYLNELVVIPDKIDDIYRG
jgi:hypothetical protein